jgi:hypothetical protein
MVIRSVRWNVRGLYREGSHREAKCKLNLVGVAVRRDKASHKLAGSYTFFHRNWNENDEISAAFLYIKESYQQLKQQALLEREQCTKY